jgi:hypothetical protein
MARRNLASLAALGTLGYMLSKKGDKKSDDKDEKSTTAAAERRIAADKDASAIPEKSESPAISDETIKRNTSGMDVQDEFGMVNKRLKRNPETGELYDTEVTAPSKKPAASPAKPAPKPAIKSRPMSAAGEAAFQEANADPSGSKYTSTKDFMGMGTIARKSPYVYDEHQGGVHGDAGYGSKRGGLMKAKKMASGGSVSSASKRADGIATKGKTRGRMC